MTTRKKKLDGDAQAEAPAPLQLVNTEPGYPTIATGGTESALNRLGRRIQAEPKPGGEAA